ncbi:hypothetical protein D3C75_1163820 [compost metagenome]
MTWVTVKPPFLIERSPLDDGEATISTLEGSTLLYSTFELSSLYHTAVLGSTGVDFVVTARCGGSPDGVRESVALRL